MFSYITQTFERKQKFQESFFWVYTHLLLLDAIKRILISSNKVSKTSLNITNLKTNKLLATTIDTKHFIDILA